MVKYYFIYLLCSTDSVWNPLLSCLSTSRKPASFLSLVSLLPNFDTSVWQNVMLTALKKERKKRNLSLITIRLAWSQHKTKKNPWVKLGTGLSHKDWREMHVSIWIGLEGLGQGSSPVRPSSQLWTFTAGVGSCLHSLSVFHCWTWKKLLSSKLTYSYTRTFWFCQIHNFL